MNKKIMWLVLSGLMVISLVMAACGPATPTTPTTPATTTPTTPTTPTSPTSPTTPTTPTAPAAAVPKYGGTLTLRLGGDITSFDEYKSMSPTTFSLTHEELVTGDWTKGPAGTGECDWTLVGSTKLTQSVGAVAESWELPEVGHMVWHIRHGIHWALDPNSEASRLVNGRELTADDVVFTLKRVTTEPRAYIKTAYPDLSATIEVTAPDDYTVVIKVPVSQYSNALGVLPDLIHIVCPEPVQKYGNMDNWKWQVGTGPFILTDYVAGSQALLVRNPNYWDKDPIGPGKGNQLPYLDAVKFLILPDNSTAQAALRVGKLDRSAAGTITDLQSALQGAPDLQYKKTLGHTAACIAMWVNKPNLPFYDKRVRQALMMGTDFNIIKDQLYEGDAEIQSWPNPYQKEYKSIFVPISEMPSSVQELYQYNPDKSKVLLKEAGYPTGFKTRIICSDTHVDYLAVIKDMWSKIGVDLELDIKASATYSTISTGLTYDEMMYAGAGGAIGRYYSCNTFDGTGYFNPSQVADPVVKKAVAEMADLFNIQDFEKLDEIYRNLLPYVLEQAWVIPKPAVYGYNLWWPWVKNYHGESSIGYTNTSNYPKYIWLDQDLKASMGFE